MPQPYSKAYVRTPAACTQVPGLRPVSRSGRHDAGAGYGRGMTSTPQEPVNAAEEEPAGESVAGLVTSEDDLPEPSDDEVEVGLGPAGSAPEGSTLSGEPPGGERLPH